MNERSIHVHPYLMSSFLNVILAAPLLVLWVVAIVDVSRRSDISTGGKWLRIAGIVLIPYVGVFVYYAWRPDIGVADPEGDAAPTGLVADIEAVLQSTPESAGRTDDVRRLIHDATSERKS